MRSNTAGSGWRQEFGSTRCDARGEEIDQISNAPATHCESGQSEAGVYAHSQSGVSIKCSGADHL